ncbi:putative amidohydrolase [Caldisphaera lagunensis DSM 15908]|uniref:Putative amidohydrolase n=1 Tax=Caldisphaera lagunensis (strain DSM 15908 / JCM 11604 / ANMR 0165 / IC-154) TaxID=1056495 RepID=L0A9Y7_CALLD|nr:carbon-nitrogen hydrolase family protein [Caldisphaera lagunensis]AFZ70234.1 putative amidohydrolase [Caldisphaera lagunensis DSM 15908]
MEKLKITIVQFRRRPLIDENLWNAISLVKNKTDIIVFSENWLSNKPIALNDYSYYLEKIGNILDANILGGIQYVYDNGYIKSVGMGYIDGKLVKICEKINPSKAVGERNYLVEGKYVKPIKVNSWYIGCVACVDIFYPEISRIHALNNADILYNPASISNESLALWHSTLQTRAAENVVYSIGVNNTNTVYPDNRITAGGSIVFNPHGDKIIELGSDDEAIDIILDYDYFNYVKNRWAFRDDLIKKYSIFYKNNFL